jgi:hypothetical protein
MNTNVESRTVSSAPRLRKQAVYAQYKKRAWWGQRNASTVGLIHTCYCGAEFRTSHARDRHLQQCHEDSA